MWFGHGGDLFSEMEPLPGVADLVAAACVVHPWDDALVPAYGDDRPPPTERYVIVVPMKKAYGMKAERFGDFQTSRAVAQSLWSLISTMVYIIGKEVSRTLHKKMPESEESLHEDTAPTIHVSPVETGDWYSVFVEARAPHENSVHHTHGRSEAAEAVFRMFRNTGSRLSDHYDTLPVDDTGLPIVEEWALHVHVRSAISPLYTLWESHFSQQLQKTPPILPAGVLKTYAEFMHAVSVYTGVEVTPEMCRGDLSNAGNPLSPLCWASPHFAAEISGDAACSSQCLANFVYEKGGFPIPKLVTPFPLFGVERLMQYYFPWTQGSVCVRLVEKYGQDVMEKGGISIVFGKMEQDVHADSAHERAIRHIQASQEAPVFDHAGRPMVVTQRRRATEEQTQTTAISFFAIPDAQPQQLQDPFFGSTAALPYVSLLRRAKPLRPLATSPASLSSLLRGVCPGTSTEAMVKEAVDILSPITWVKPTSQGDIETLEMQYKAEVRQLTEAYTPDCGVSYNECENILALRAIKRQLMLGPSSNISETARRILEDTAIYKIDEVPTRWEGAPYDVSLMPSATYLAYLLSSLEYVGNVCIAHKFGVLLTLAMPTAFRHGSSILGLWALHILFVGQAASSKSYLMDLLDSLLRPEWITHMSYTTQKAMTAGHRIDCMDMFDEAQRVTNPDPHKGDGGAMEMLKSAMTGKRIRSLSLFINKEGKRTLVPEVADWKTSSASNANVQPS